MFSEFGGPKVQRKATFVGTRDYISPEMADDSLSGPFSDIWALGIIAYELYVGKRPWTSKSEAGVFEEIRKSQVSYPPTIP